MFAALIARKAGASPRERVSGESLLRALAPYRQPDSAGTFHDEQALVCHALHWNTPPSLHETSPETCPHSGRIIASWVRLDNRAELCAKLGLVERTELTDPRIILAAFGRWHRDCAQHLEGDFSFVIHDPASRETYCARDGMGAKPFYFLDTGDTFIAASSVAAIRAGPRLGLQPNLEWIALYASGFNFADGETTYEDIAKLPPGHDLSIEPGEPIQSRRYFDFELTAPHARKRDTHWVDLYRQEFDRAVAVRARSHFHIGAESSAGLDSASIVASLIDKLPHGTEDFHTFALINHQRELDLLEELSSHCGIVHTHKAIQPEMLAIDASVERAHTVIGHPPEHGQPLLSTAFFEQCEARGIRTMMSGYGGDEIVTGYAKYLIDELIARRDLRAAFDEIEGHLPMRIARLARWRLQGRPHPDATARGMIAAKLATACLSNEFLEDTGLRRRIDGWMMPELQSKTINNIAALAPGFRHARTGRLESSALYAGTYGVEYRFPMFDRRLIQFFLKVPSIEKRHRSMGRYLHRRAMAGRIPNSILWQPSKEMGAPLGGITPIAKQPKLTHDELPSAIKHLFDVEALATTEGILEKEDPMSHKAMRTAYFSWTMRQLCYWLESH